MSNTEVLLGAEGAPGKQRQEPFLLRWRYSVARRKLQMTLGSPWGLVDLEKLASSSLSQWWDSTRPRVQLRMQILTLRAETPRSQVSS